MRSEELGVRSDGGGAYNLEAPQNIILKYKHKAHSRSFRTFDKEGKISSGKALFLWKGGRGDSSHWRDEMLCETSV